MSAQVQHPLRVVVDLPLLAIGPSARCSLGVVQLVMANSTKSKTLVHALIYKLLPHPIRLSGHEQTCEIQLHRDLGIVRIGKLINHYDLGAKVHLWGMLAVAAILSKYMQGSHDSIIHTMSDLMAT